MYLGHSGRAYNSGSFADGQTFTLTGSGFGTKSRAAAAYVRDRGGAGAGVLDNQWKNGYTRGNAAAGGIYNIQNQVGSTFNPNGNASVVGTPHSGITNIMAWANAGNNSNTGWLGGPYVDYAFGTLPVAMYSSCYYRADPSWTFGGSSRNFKWVGITSTGDVLGGTNGVDVDWFWCYGSGSGPGNTTTVDYQIQMTDNLNALEEPGNVDPAGNSAFQGKVLSPFNPNNGWIKVETEILITSTTGTGAGYCKVWCNGQLVLWYQGRTWNSSKTTATLMGGPHLFTNDYNFTTNFNYAADWYVDCTGTLGSATGSVARIYLSNDPNPFKGTINSGWATPWGNGLTVAREPQDILTMSDTIITGTCRKGALSSGTIYAGVQSENGNQQVLGPFTLQ